MTRLHPARVRSRALILAAALAPALISALPAASADVRTATVPTGSPWVVSVGDSYISGEAGRWAGNDNDSESAMDALGPTAYYDNASHTAELINRCHR
jgi:hypothetical protein